MGIRDSAWVFAALSIHSPLSNSPRDLPYTFPCSLLYGRLSPFPDSVWKAELRASTSLVNGRSACQARK